MSTALTAMALGWLWNRVPTGQPTQTVKDGAEIVRSLAAAGYVEPPICEQCHAEIAETYRKTGMGHSFYRLTAETAVEDFGVGNTYYHKASERSYEMIARDGRYYQRRYQKGPGGEEINLLEKEIHFVMGSGNRARTYLHYTGAGKIVQLPLAWYAEKDGHWALNPGYDRPNHPGFQRAISYDCMFCHNGYPLTPPGQDVVGRRPLFREPLPEGIDCQRCHGPGRAHVEAAGSGSPSPNRIRDTIVNPARLDAERQLDICFQCHLETTSRALPNVVHRFDRGYFSFRPGEAMTDYALYFDHTPGTRWGDKFEINHAGYRLRKSACFKESGGALVCTTCHDPHRKFVGTEAATRYEAACRGCHLAAFDELISAGRHIADNDCTACHMPKRRTDDVVHAVMTDHYIQRRKPAGDLLAERKEATSPEETRYRGEVVAYYPTRTLGPADELYTAVAQVMQGSNLEAGTVRLENAIAKHQPEEAGFYFELGAAYEESGRHAEASSMFERAIAKNPNFALAQRRLGEVLSKLGEDARAEAALRKAAELDPGDGENFKELGLHLARQARFLEASEVSRKGLVADPELPALHNNLGGALMELGSMEGAERAYREAIRLQPDLAEAQFNLANILATNGNFELAEYHWKQAIRSDPKQALVRYNYAVALAGRDQLREAEEQLRAALGANPKFARAHTLLGNVLEVRGRLTDAIEQHRRAVELEANSAEAHWNLAAALLAQGQTSAARASLEKTIEIEPVHYEAHLALGRVLASERQVAEARTHLHEAMKSSDTEVRAAAENALALLPR